MGGTGNIYAPNGIWEGIYASGTTQFFDFVILHEEIIHHKSFHQSSGFVRTLMKEALRCSSSYWRHLRCFCCCSCLPSLATQGCRPRVRHWHTYIHHLGIFRIGPRLFAGFTLLSQRPINVYNWHLLELLHCMSRNRCVANRIPGRIVNTIGA